MSGWAKQTLWGWGRYPRVESMVTRPERRREVLEALAQRNGSPILAYGEGRSYGDAALLRDGRVVLTRRLDRMLDFDPATGWLRCEAGVSLDDIITTFAPRGWFPPVVPGTRFVSVGGAVSCDIHGKNHHVHGTFCDHVRQLEVLTAGGEIVVCSPELEPELFWATVGGMGLTGLILSAEVQLYPIETELIELESIRVENLDHFFELSAESTRFTHIVSWIDCVKGGLGMGRGILMRGRHAPAGSQPTGELLGRLVRLAEPVLDGRPFKTNWLMNNATMALFNQAYFHRHPKGLRKSVVGFGPFFFPLDAVRNWNLLYGDRGMLQYQLVVPPDPEHRAIREILERVTGAGMASFLAVIKEFGDRSHPGLSFPAPGVTLALDFPNYGDRLFELLNQLDAIVAGAGGRVYLCKDARLSRERFREMYPEWESWKAVRDRWDPGEVFQSELGRRLGLVGGV